MGNILLRRVDIVKKYIEKYPDIFTDREKDFLIGYAKSDKGRDLPPDLIREVYDELGLLSDEENIYIGFMNMLDNEFDIKDRNIIEVGGGILPRLARRISEMQDKGKIVVYDPRLSKYEQETPKMKLVPRKYKRNTNPEDCDLLIGLMPCEAAEVIIDSATNHGIDFMVALCEGGPHGEDFDYFEDEDEWRHSLMISAERKLEERDMGKLKVKYLKEYGDPYPVIYNDRKPRS